MSRRYDNIYADKPLGFQVEGLTSGAIGLCAVCQSETHFGDDEFKRMVCCDDCRVLLWQRIMKEQRSGHFKSYTFQLKNGTKKEFTEVRAWFAANDQGSFLYIEQLDIEPHLKTRWDLGDMSDILTGERLPDL